MKKNVLFYLVTILLLLQSCSKEEGFGGLATIRGKVFGQNFNQNGVLIAENYIGDVRVYISKHEDPIPFGDVRSSYDGSYEFEFLHEGKYDIWVFGDCDFCPWDQMFDKKTVEITSKRQTVEVEDLVISN